MNVCILGLGYVGLTLALSFADCGVKVFGVDNNNKIISSLKNRKSTISEKNVEPLLNKHLGKNFEVSEVIPNTDIDNFVLSVGTPINENKKGKILISKSSFFNNRNHELIIDKVQVLN